MLLRFLTTALFVVSAEGFNTCSLRFKRTVSLNRERGGSFEKVRRIQISILKSYDRDDSSSSLPLKSVAIAAVAVFGVFGFGFLTPIKTALKELSGPSQSLDQPKLKSSSSEENRGTMTKLTKREINDKLSQIPVFFAYNEDNKIFISDGTGEIFVDKIDADEYASKNGLKVAATSLDNLYYTLVNKKTKIASYLNNIAKKSSFEANYKLVPSSRQLPYVTAEWLSSHPDDVPLFRVSSLAFTKEEGIEIPLFTRKEDALLSYSRLKDAETAKGNTAFQNSKSDNDAIQTISLLELVGKLEKGGFEGRALEVYPDINAIEDAKKIFTD